MYGLLLDDERNPGDVTWIKYPDNVEWVVVRNSAKFIDEFWNLVKSGKEYIVSFDHDIQEFDTDSNEEITGYTVLQTMIDAIQYYGLSVPMCYFHSMNPVGRDNMEVYYKNFAEFYAEEMEK